MEMTQTLCRINQYCTAWTKKVNLPPAEGQDAHKGDPLPARKLKLPYRSYRESCNENVGDDVDSSTSEGETENRSEHVFSQPKNETHAFILMHFAVAFSLMVQNADTGTQAKIRTSSELTPAATQMAPTI